jgi:ubiquinone/menaquinone biosynthesis C-methylase UbiE/uncharacterized protein YbaR (Trm112 family)
MQNKLLKFLNCPQCFDDLELKEEIVDNDQITEGTLSCNNCKLSFIIQKGVPIFGVKSSDKYDRFKEIDGENEWVWNVNDIKVHVDFAKESSEDGEKIIKKINQILKNRRIENKLKFLDLGSGWGCFQSWQFAKQGHEVVAVDLCPEFIMSSDQISKDCYFERIIADCTILPFKNETFDIIFCKELIHHISNPMDLLNEIYRISSPGGIIIIFEPCTSIFLVERSKNIEEASITSKIGIGHYSYTYYNYLNFIGRIATEIQIDGKIHVIDKKSHKILNILQKPIIYLSQISSLNKIIIKMHLIIIGSSIEVIGIKKENYYYEETKREITPLSIKNQNFEQINFYRNKLIPQVFKIFSDTYKKHAKK